MTALEQARRIIWKYDYPVTSEDKDAYSTLFENDELQVTYPENSCENLRDMIMTLKAGFDILFFC